MIEGINQGLWRWNISLHRDPVGVNTKGVSFTGDFEKGEILFYQETLFSFWGGDPVGEPGGGFFYREIWETVKECSINGASVSMGSLWGKCGRREFRKLGLVGTRKQTRKLIADLSPTVKTRKLYFNRTQFSVVIGLFIGHNTMKRYLYLMKLINSHLCRRCGAEEETAANVLCECEALASLRRTHLGSFSWTQRMFRVSKSGVQLELQ